MKTSCQKGGEQLTSKKVVFFEKITPAVFPLVRKYLDKGFTVYFFKIDEKCRKKLNERLIDASSIVFEYDIFARAGYYAHRNLDELFTKFFENNPSIKIMAKMLSPHVRYMYMYRFLQNLKKLYEIELKINEIIKNKNVEAHFVTSNILVHGAENSPLTKKVKLIHPRGIKFFFERLKQKANAIVLLGAPIYIFVKKVKQISDKKKRKKFKIGIMVHPHPRSIFDLSQQSALIFLDSKELPPKHVLFVDGNLKTQNLKGYRTHKFNYTFLFHDKEILSKQAFTKLVRNFSLVWLKLLPLSLLEHPIIVRTNATILYEYVLWNIFADTYQLEHYICRLLPDNISKLQILSQHGTKTWFVYPDNTTTEYHISWGKNKRIQTLFTFLHYDYAIIYGEAVERYFKTHRNFIKKYFKVGVLLSQLIREIENGQRYSPLLEIIKRKKFPKKIIGVFDTTYVDYGPVKIRDGIKFAQDILKLLEEMPDVGVIFLAKKSKEDTPAPLLPIYNKLENHERCLLFYRWGKEKVSSVDVIAVSDLIISAPYTSAVAEALGAKKKGIYYDASGHDTDKGYYFNNFPKLVAHSYSELKELVKFWLHDMTKKKFEKYLMRYVKNEIDPYLDGKALTRFRNLLMKTSKNKGIESG